MANVIEDTAGNIVGKILVNQDGTWTYDTSGALGDGSVTTFTPIGESPPGTSSPTTTSTADTLPLSPLDWRDYLTNWGFPADVVNQLDSIFRGDEDPQRAAQRALAYIRGTDWYAGTFPGIEQAKSMGLVQDETGYRALLNQQNQLYQSYLGRSITSAEFSTNLQQGLSTSLVAARFQAQGYKAVIGADAVTNLFTPDELQQMANEHAGIGSQNGQYLLALHDYAQSVMPVLAQYGGDLSRANIENFYRAGTSAEVIARQFQSQSFGTLLGGQNAASLFTPSELQAMANESAGIGSSVQGKYLLSLYNYAQDMMPMLNQFGAGANRQTIEGYYKQGLSTTQVSQQLGAQGYSQVLATQNISNLFTADELQQMANEQAGINTPNGKQLLAMHDYAQQILPILQQYGVDSSRQAIEGYLAQGVSGTALTRQLESQGYTRMFGAENISSLFSQDELKQMSDESAGLGTTNGKYLLGLHAYASQAFSILNQYGAPASRQDIETFYKQGVSPENLTRQLESQGFSQVLGRENVVGMFTPDELKQIADEQAGLGTTNGKYLIGLHNYFQQTLPIAQQYGQSTDRAALENQYMLGTSPDMLHRQYAGDQYAAVNAPDIQFLSGAYGGGQLSQDQLTAYGRQQTGIDSVLGGQLQERLAKAQQRLASVFQGTLAKPALSFANGGLSAPSLLNAKTPDIGR